MSRYNALQVKVQRRFANGLGSMLSYTWSRKCDTNRIATPSSRRPFAANIIACSIRGVGFAGDPKTTALNSPWDVLVHEQDLYIAMAGPHQIWKMPLDEAEEV